MINNILKNENRNIKDGKNKMKNKKMNNSLCKRCRSYPLIHSWCTYTKTCIPTSTRIY